MVKARNTQDLSNLQDKHQRKGRSQTNQETPQGGGGFSTLTEGFADVRNSLEDPVREVDFDLDVLHVGQLQAQQLVLRGELELGIRLDPVFIQRPVSFKEPSFLLFPPQSVIRPVLLDICNKEAIFPQLKAAPERAFRGQKKFLKVFFFFSSFPEKELWTQKLQQLFLDTRNCLYSVVF